MKRATTKQAWAIDGNQPSRGAERGAARRAWLSALLVWSFAFQLLAPVLGPMRLGDGTAMAALGRIMPICTIEGLRLAEPAGGNGEADGDAALVDAGWHCILCVTPATEPTETAGVPEAPAAWRFAWTIPAPDSAPTARLRSPQSARGPPLHS